MSLFPFYVLGQITDINEDKCRASADNPHIPDFSYTKIRSKRKAQQTHSKILVVNKRSSYYYAAIYIYINTSLHLQENTIFHRHQPRFNKGKQKLPGYNPYPTQNQKNQPPHIYIYTCMSPSPTWKKSILRRTSHLRDANHHRRRDLDPQSQEVHRALEAEAQEPQDRLGDLGQVVLVGEMFEAEAETVGQECDWAGFSRLLWLGVKVTAAMVIGITKMASSTKD